MRGGASFDRCWLVLEHFLDLLLPSAFARFQRGDGMLRLIRCRGLCSLAQSVFKSGGADHRRRLLRAW